MHHAVGVAAGDVVVEGNVESRGSVAEVDADGPIVVLASRASVLCAWAKEIPSTASSAHEA